MRELQILNNPKKLNKGICEETCQLKKCFPY